MKKIFFFLLIVFVNTANATDMFGVYPTHWWVGMKNPKLQIILHGENIKQFSKVSITYPGIRIDKTTKLESNNYLIVDITITATAKPGRFKIILSGGGLPAEDINYELKPRSKENGKTRIKGVTSEDMIYLLMPDRFSNGDPSNDFFADMRDTGHDRNNPFDRHGGDLKGVQDHLDYLKDLGATAIWMTPVNENNMSRTLENGTLRSTYHGYAFTDQYEVDRRLGGNEAYKSLIEEAHKKGMKIVQDAVYNHIGNDHWMYRDLPAKDWINQWPSYQNTSHKNQTLFDPNASKLDAKITADGWFTPFLVDLNQQNPFVSNFLIQYAVWATEEFGLDGWRVDTYFYNDPPFLNRINDVLRKEFPKITVFGETAVNLVTSTAYYSENTLTVPFKHNCPGVTDFPVMFSIHNAIKQPFSWDGGVNNLYTTLAQDLLYKNPMNNCTSLDNHDQDRIYSILGENMRKYKMAIAMLFTIRGIPQLYYGTEILMKNFKDPTDAEVRKDFPGGWPGDAQNKFDASGRTAEENEAFNYVKTLANFRKNSSAIKNGKTMQFVPENGVYVYFRYTSTQTVMCIVNSNETPATIDLSRFAERMNGFTKALDAATGATFNLEPTLTLGEKYVLVLELKK
jgi:neopullulanase